MMPLTIAPAAHDGPLSDWKSRIEEQPPVRFASLAEKALADRRLDRDECLGVLSGPDDELPDLLSAAFAVRSRHFGRRVKVCVLLNARSGLCPEDCGYCSQAKGADTGIDRYRLMDRDSIIARAEAAASAGAKRFCIVCSGRGPSDRDIDHISGAVAEITRRHPGLEICCSLGLMSRPQAEKLAAAGVDYVNHNLNTGRNHHPKIVSTHTYEDRVETINNVKAAGLATCSGGIVGMGETDEDIADLAAAVREMDIASIPINFLISFDGTPMQGMGSALTWQKGLRVLSLMRLMNPAKEIRMAAGRERKLGGRQSLSLYAANSIFVDGYLTTEGQAAAAAREMIESAGFEVEA
jgi:biotin synthase